MAMLTAYFNGVANYGGNTLINYIGLVNATGTEISGGSYARKAVTWGSASGGTIRPTADLTFDIPSGVTVGGWRGFSALTAGTNYGGASLTNESFASAGQYILDKDTTGINHEAGA